MRREKLGAAELAILCGWRMAEMVEPRRVTHTTCVGVSELRILLEQGHMVVTVVYMTCSPHRFRRLPLQITCLIPQHASSQHTRNTQTQLRATLHPALRLTFWSSQKYSIASFTFVISICSHSASSCDVSVTMPGRVPVPGHLPDGSSRSGT